MSQDSKTGKTMIGTLAPPLRPRGPDAPTIGPPLTRPQASQPLATLPPQPTPPPTPHQLDNESTLGMGPGARPARSSEAPDVFLGQELCGYAIRRKLAEGGMGEVYEGQHTKIGRLAAIKVLKLELCRDEGVVERFYQEARAVNSIRHENIVDIYDFGRDPHGRVFFVMEYLEGEPLSTRIRRGALPWAEAFPILHQTLRALKAAHDTGFVHRDLKPDNIWLRYVDGRIQVKLLDFGIAKLVGSDEKLTRTGSVIGTPHYMSPEQINGARDIDQRTDLYALGVIMFEMFAGVTPFLGETLQAIMTGHLFREPPRLAQLPADLGVPTAIAEIIDRMLVKDPTGRYASATDVLADLYDVHANKFPTNAETLNRVRPTRAPTLVGPQVAPAPRGKRGLLAAGALAVLAVAGGAVYWQMRQPAAVVATIATIAPVQKQADPPPPPVTPDDTQLRNSAKGVLRQALTQVEPEVRRTGVDAVAEVHDQPSIPALSGMVESDADEEVRGHSADALVELAAPNAVRTLIKLAPAAPPVLRAWLSADAARLGDDKARKQLVRDAGDRSFDIAYKASSTLASLAKPNDARAIAALRAVLKRALTDGKDRALQADLFYRLAALRDAPTRQTLYATLESTDEADRLTAAEVLARLGDDAGKQVMQDIARGNSPNQLSAAVALIKLGDYSGLAVITHATAEADAGRRALAVRALGAIGDRASLTALGKLQAHAVWTTRIAAAVAIVRIVGVDPALLAQASVDWTRGALASQDWAVREAAAGVLANLPAKHAESLLARAIADPDTRVRRSASRAAGQIKTAGAAEQVVAALQQEKAADVQEEQVRALGRIGKVGAPAAHDALAAMAQQPSRVGVLAAGSLIAVGDPAGAEKLEHAIAPAQPTALRLAAVEAAAVAGDPVTLPTFKLGALDRVERIRVLAAEGLTELNAERAIAEPVLTAALKSSDRDLVGRAIAALTRLGAPTGDRSPAELLDDADPKHRLAVVPIVRALPPATAVPLLRRLVADPDPEVRHAGVDAIRGVADAAEDEAVKLYRPLTSDGDPVVRAKAQGELSRLVKATPVTASTTPTPTSKDVKLAADRASTADGEATAAQTSFEGLQTELATATAKQRPAKDVLDRAKALKTELAAAADALATAASTAEAAATEAAEAAGPNAAPDAIKLVDAARANANHARELASAARTATTTAAKQADDFIASWTKRDPALWMNVASVGTDFAEAKATLDEAAAMLRGSSPDLDFAYATLYERWAKATSDPAQRAERQRKTIEYYDRFARTGTGPNVKLAAERAAELKQR